MAQRLTLLLDTDAPWTADQIRNVLGADCNVRILVGPPATLNAADTAELDLVLLCHPDNLTAAGVRAVWEKLCTHDSPAALLAVVPYWSVEQLRELLRSGIQETLCHKELDKLPAVLPRLLARVKYQRGQSRRYQDQLQRERQLREGLVASRTALWSWSLTDNRLEQAENLLELFGLSADSGMLTPTLQAELISRVEPEDLDRLRAEIRAAEPSRQSFQAELRVKVGDEQRWFDVRGRYEGDPTAAPSRVAGVTTDIHDRKLAELALLMGERRIREFMENGPMVAFVKRPDGSYEYINHLFRTLLFALPAPPIINQTDHDIFPKPIADRLREQDLSIWSSRNNWYGVERVPLADGRLCSWWVTKFIYTDHNGREFLGGLAIDLTDRIVIEERNHELWDQIAHQNRLSVMGQLVSELTHELNQPLYAVSNFTEAALTQLRQTGDGAQVRDWLAQVQTQAQRMRDIIRRISGYTAKTPPQETSADLVALVRECCEFLAPRFRHDQIEISVELPADLPPAAIEPLQFQQVLINLLTNAAEALSDTNSADRRIKVAVSQFHPAQLAIRIADNGPGLQQTDAKRIFEPFMTTKPEGMGLGLSIVRSIIESHGGTIQAVPNSPQGLLFNVCLPISPRPTEHASPHT